MDYTIGGDSYPTLEAMLEDVALRWVTGEFGNSLEDVLPLLHRIATNDDAARDAARLIIAGYALDVIGGPMGDGDEVSHMTRYKYGVDEIAAALQNVAGDVPEWLREYYTAPF